MTTQDFTTLVRNQVTAIQSKAKSLLDFTIGSVLRSVVESNSAVVLWLQGLILQVLALTRAATSSGADLDSWVNDYGFSRLPAVAATGQVTFSRFMASLQAVVLIGTQVETADGGQVFIVTVDTTNAAYNAGLGGYVLPVNTASIDVPVEAMVPGSAGNVIVDGLNTFTQSIPGVDIVTNAAAFTNGADAETDSALRTRFVAWIASLSKATKNAIGYAITSLQSGLQYKLVENQDYNGTTKLGYFFVVIDDGTGVPTSELLASVGNAVDAVRAVAITFGVFAPVVLTADVVMVVTVAAGYDSTATKALVQAAIQNYINALPLGQTLFYTRLTQVAYDASSGVTNVTGVTLNAGVANLTATDLQVIKAGTVMVN